MYFAKASDASKAAVEQTFGVITAYNHDEEVVSPPQELSRPLLMPRTTSKDYRGGRLKAENDNNNDTWNQDEEVGQERNRNDDNPTTTTHMVSGHGFEISLCGRSRLEQLSPGCHFFFKSLWE